MAFCCRYFSLTVFQDASHNFCCSQSKYCIPCQEEIDGEDEVEDAFTEKEEELGAVEEERSVILHLLSQLKLGMDLTRVGRVPQSCPTPRTQPETYVGLDQGPARQTIVVPCFPSSDWLM